MSVPQLYGATYTYFAHVLPTLGIEVRFPADDTPESIGALIDERTKAVFCETVGNPAGNVIDLAAVAAVAHDRGVPVIADNTVPTPLLLKPIQHGADVVIHSLTKFVGGHGTTMGGMIIDAGTFPWARPPGAVRLHDRARAGVPRRAIRDRVPGRAVRDPLPHGRAAATPAPSLSPFNAFLLLQGLETLPVRLPRHEANARRVAEFLAADPASPGSASSASPTTPITSWAGDTSASARSRS